MKIKKTYTLEDSCTGDGQAVPMTVRSLQGLLFFYGGVKLKKSMDEIKSALDEVSSILLTCSEKALVLKVCNDYATQEEGFFIGKMDISLLYSGMSNLLYEIVEKNSEAQNLLESTNALINGICKPGQGVTA